MTKKSRSSRGAYLCTNLPALQNLCKRDPVSYRDEFLTQYAHYQSQLRIFLVAAPAQVHSSAASHAPTTGTGSATNAFDSDFPALVHFIAQLSASYPTETRTFADDLRALVLDRGAVGLAPATRLSLVQALVLLRHKGALPQLALFDVLFPVLANTTSSASHAPLRSYLRHTILNDLKTANATNNNAVKLNKAVQAMLFKILDAASAADLGPSGSLPNNSPLTAQASYAVQLASHCWRKHIWTDAQTVSLLATACFFPNAKVQTAALKFFLGDSNEDLDVEDSDQEEVPDYKKELHRRTINKTRRSTDRKTRTLAVTVKKKRKELAAKRLAKANFPAIELLRDPQTFAERLYTLLSKFGPFSYFLCGYLDTDVAEQTNNTHWTIKF